MNRYRTWLTLVASIVVVGLSGCANFGAVKEFAKEGDGITTAVNAEMAFVAKGCAESVDVYRSLQADPTARGPLDKACEVQDKALSELAANTLDLFGKYNQALAALADDKNYDLSASFKSTADRLKALKTRAGPVIKGEDVDVALKAANLLSDLALRAVRARELKELMKAGDIQWAAVMSPLKTYFGPHAGNRQVVPSPYEISVRANAAPLEAAMGIARSFSGSDLSGAGPGCVVPANPKQAFEVRCETMWARQLAYQIAQKRNTFKDRLPDPDRPSEPAPTAKRIQDAIDAWVATHAVLREEIAKLNSDQVWASLQQLKGKVEELDEAPKAHD